MAEVFQEGKTLAFLGNLGKRLDEMEKRSYTYKVAIYGAIAKW